MRRLPTVLTDAQLSALYYGINERTSTGKRDRALLQVMADAGLRVSEALHLRPQDLRQESGRVVALEIHAGKGDKDRTAYCTAQLSDKLLRWLDARAAIGVNGRAPVFCRIKGGPGLPLGARTVEERVKALAEAAGLEQAVHPHTLRHTYATRLLRAGGNLRLVQEALGHARITTTEIYTHVTSAEREMAALALPEVDHERT